MKTPLFLDNGQASFGSAQIIVAPIPFEGAISYMSGAELGPEAILEASSQVELYDFETGSNLESAAIHTVNLSQFHSLSEMFKFVSDIVSRIDDKNQFYLGIGGDHTVTIPAIETFSKRYPNLGIVQIDAHADLRNELHGDRYSHACIMRRNAEIVGPKNILPIGIRAVSLEEKQYIDANGVEAINGNFSLHEDLLPKLRERLFKLPKDIFLTVDLDGLDPTIMPHVGTPVPGGLSWFQTMQVIKEVFKTKNVIAADVVEIASGPATQRSDFTAALLCQKICSLWFNGK